MDLERQIAIIQIYIKCRKNVDVDITPVMPYDIPKIMHAYKIAKEWLDTNNVSIKPV